MDRQENCTSETKHLMKLHGKQTKIKLNSKLKKGISSKKRIWVLRVSKLTCRFKEMIL